MRHRRWIPRLFLSLRLFLPGLFALSALLLFLKGISTPPSHDDGLCYRIPRAMSWIMDHHWHWLSATDRRLDILGTVSEWLSVPILMIFKTDRLVFLPNWISHLFLPGLIFSVWRSLGVSQKIAWLAMWLLPTGFCFALQAVNTSNDSLAAFFVMAAFFYALKKGAPKPWSDFALSILCMSLATGVKLNQIPFVLPWVVAMGAGWKTMFSRPGPVAAVLSWGALISFLPTALINWSHGRGWTGLSFDVLPPPGVNYVCTTYRILADNLMPPVVAFTPWGKPFLLGIQHSLLGGLLNQYYHEAKPVFYVQLAIQQVGIGFIVSVLLVLMILATRGRRVSLKIDAVNAHSLRRSLIFLGLCVAFLHYLFFVNSDQPARLICTFYLLLTPVFFSGRVLRRWVPWRGCKLFAGMGMLAGLYLALFLAENPPFCLLHVLNERQQVEDRLKTEVNGILSGNEKTIGIIRDWNQREAWLWQPYGSRRVVEFPDRPDLVQIDRLGIRHLIISKKALDIDNLTIESWLAGQPWILDAYVQPEPNTHGWYPVNNNWYVVERKPGPEK